MTTPRFIPAPQTAAYRRIAGAPQAQHGPQTDYEITGFTVDFIRARSDECVLVTDNEGTKWRIPRAVVSALSGRGFDSGAAACKASHRRLVTAVSTRVTAD